MVRETNGKKSGVTSVLARCRQEAGREDKRRDGRDTDSGAMLGQKGRVNLPETEKSLN